MNQAELLKLSNALDDLTNTIRSSFTLITTVIALLILLFGVYLFTCVMEEWWKWKERKSKKKGKSVEKGRKNRSSKSLKSKSSKASKTKSSKSSKSKSANKKSEKSLKKKRAVTKPKETIIDFSKESTTKVGKAAPPLPPPPPKTDDKSHVTFINAKENSTLTAPNYQKIEAKWPSSTPTSTPPPKLDSSKSPSISGVSTPPTTAKQLSDPRCPGDDSFGTSVSSFSSSFTSFNSSSSRKQKRKYEIEDLIAPPSNEALTKGTYFTKAMIKTPKTVVAPVPKVSEPKLYKPSEVPSQFASDGAVTAREDTEPLTYTKTAQSPMSSIFASDITPMMTSPTQSSLSISTTQGSTASPIYHSAPTIPIPPTSTTPVASAAAQLPPNSTSSSITVADTQSDKTPVSTPKNNV